MVYTTSIFAATREVKGLVTSDGDNLPLIGASVFVSTDALKKINHQTESIGVMTAIDGSFIINVPDGITRIYCSYLGHNQKEIKLGKETFYNIHLEPSSYELDNIVVTGYQNIERRKLTSAISKVLSPVIDRLFPEIPKGHKSLEYISSNITANMLGLGWAATPAGLDAMKSLSELNRGRKTASKSMCMFMVINISSVQLITINIIAYRTSFSSANPSAVIIPGIIATSISTAAGILAVKIAERFTKDSKNLSDHINK